MEVTFVSYVRDGKAEVASVRTNDEGAALRYVKVAYQAKDPRVISRGEAARFLGILPFDKDQPE